MEQKYLFLIKWSKSIMNQLEPNRPKPTRPEPTRPGPTPSGAARSLRSFTAYSTESLKDMKPGLKLS